MKKRGTMKQRGRRGGGGTRRRRGRCRGRDRDRQLPRELHSAGCTGPQLFLGKIDSPLGFERDDEPLNLQSTTSFNFEFGRPIKLVGIGGRWNLNPRLNLLLMVTNGWESQIDPNRGKTIAGRLGILPSENSSFRVGGMFGPEAEQGEANNRSVISVDYSWQPVNDLILGGEANWGADHLQGADDHWVGGTLTVFGRLHRRFGVTLRGEIFDDRGARVRARYRSSSRSAWRPSTSSVRAETGFSRTSSIPRSASRDSSFAARFGWTSRT